MLPDIFIAVINIFVNYKSASSAGGVLGDTSDLLAYTLIILSFSID
jgi:hypothetical protein